MSFVKLNKAVELLGLHPNTLRRFADNGTIEAIKTPGGQRLYNVAILRTLRNWTFENYATSPTS